MKEYDIKITETLEKTVTVKAESMEAAQAKVEEEYYNSEHILDSENFTGVDFSAEAEREIVQGNRKSSWMFCSSSRECIPRRFR